MTKISLSNVPDTTELKTLAWMQLQRYWVERAFEDAKRECGMADYQVHKWTDWYYHMTFVMMVMLNECMRYKDTYPLLSCADIEELMAHFLHRRDVTQEEVVRQIECRHRKRLKAIQSHSRVAQQL